MLKTLTFLLIFIHLVYAADHACGGKQLLTVNDENFTILKRKVKSLSKTFLGVSALDANLHNNGKTIIIKFGYGKLIPYIDDGPYGEDNYKLEFMYFNWLRHNYSTQEILPFELHVVFVNGKYETYEKAVGKDFGLTVWSFKYDSEFDPRPNLLSADVFDALKSIRRPNTKIDLKFPRNLLPSVFDMIEYSSKYYMYQGRLTSTLHECSSDVIWLEFPRAVQIGSDAFENIKNLLSFNNKPLMEQFQDSLPPNVSIYENIEDDRNYDTDLFKATSIGIDGADVKYKKCLSLMLALGIYFVIIL